MDCQLFQVETVPQRHRVEVLLRACCQAPSLAWTQMTCASWLAILRGLERRQHPRAKAVSSGGGKAPLRCHPLFTACPKKPLDFRVPPCLPLR